MTSAQDTTSTPAKPLNTGQIKATVTLDLHFQGNTSSGQIGTALKVFTVPGGLSNNPPPVTIKLTDHLSQKIALMVDSYNLDTGEMFFSSSLILLEEEIVKEKKVSKGDLEREILGETTPISQNDIDRFLSAMVENGWEISPESALNFEENCQKKIPEPSFSQKTGFIFGVAIFLISFCIPELSFKMFRLALVASAAITTVSVVSYSNDVLDNSREMLKSGSALLLFSAVSYLLLHNILTKESWKVFTDMVTIIFMIISILIIVISLLKSEKKHQHS